MSYYLKLYPDYQISIYAYDEHDEVLGDGVVGLNPGLKTGYPGKEDEETDSD